MDAPMLCYDVIFKSVFGNLESILNKFIYDITGIHFKNISLGMNELPIVRGNEKFKRCDFVINTDQDVVINIELNRYYSNSMLIKNTGYVCSLFSKYTSRGEEYLENLKIIQININYFNRFDRPILDYQMMNYSYSYVYFRGLKIYDLDVVSSKKLYYNKSTRKRNAVRCGALFSCTKIEDMEPIIKELLNKKEV